MVRSSIWSLVVDRYPRPQLAVLLQPAVNRRGGLLDAVERIRIASFVHHNVLVERRPDRKRTNLGCNRRLDGRIVHSVQFVDIIHSFFAKLLPLTPTGQIPLQIEPFQPLATEAGTAGLFFAGLDLLIET